MLLSAIILNAPAVLFHQFSIMKGCKPFWKGSLVLAFINSAYVEVAIWALIHTKLP